MTSDMAVKLWNELAADSPMFRGIALFASDTHIDRFDAQQLQSAASFLQKWSSALSDEAATLERENGEGTDLEAESDGEEDSIDETLCDEEKEVP